MDVAKERFTSTAQNHVKKTMPTTTSPPSRENNNKGKNDINTNKPFYSRNSNNTLTQPASTTPISKE
ncbi:hypothetical protein Y032_0243g3492 [Ancylostoma ceylanicum]|uniref:Uncharacterized protein n=1 Tax=Ancylostoma ceylanicum TaxID=53326 RepID=A0A016SE55_9BILA|nr:hypothetical protein Y032_0243g3492 [Ancylostoma ceylanicum]